MLIEAKILYEYSSAKLLSTKRSDLEGIGRQCKVVASGPKNIQPLSASRKSLFRIMISVLLLRSWRAEP